MTPSTLKKQWNKTAFQRLQTGLSHERREKDEEDLQKIFSLAADVPILKDALNWAKAHDVRFAIDHAPAQDTAGYYLPGTGTVVFYKNCMDEPENCVDTLTHEIRHAWQDYHGMMVAEVGSFEEHYIQIALLEADAAAHGSIAFLQYLQKYKPDKAPKTVAYHDAAWKFFQNWFTVPDITAHYGEETARTLCKKLGVQGAPPSRAQKTYQIAEDDDNTPAIPGLQLKNKKNFIKLSQTFNGERYFPKDAYSFLKRRVVPYEHASTFYGAANDDQKKLVIEINKKIKAL